VQVFTNATSFGEPESLIQHQATSPTHGTNTGIHDDLLRLSIGLEHPDDLIADLEHALDLAHGS
jgi:cystathionine gamma-synthase